MDTLDVPPSSATKQLILETFFDYKAVPASIRDRSIFAESYFHYYRKILQACRVHKAIKTHHDIMQIVKLLKEPGGTQHSVHLSLREKFTNYDKVDGSKSPLLSNDEEEIDEAIQDSINLAVRLLLMVSIGPFLAPEGSITVSGESALAWKEGCITDLITSGLSPQKIIERHMKLEKIFNARNLERIAGIEIRWTNNLYDHLRMRDDDTAVEIFHYASFLRIHYDW